MQRCCRCCSTSSTDTLRSEWRPPVLARPHLSSSTTRQQPATPRTPSRASRSPPPASSKLLLQRNNCPCHPSSLDVPISNKCFTLEISIAQRNKPHCTQLVITLVSICLSVKWLFRHFYRFSMDFELTSFGGGPPQTSHEITYQAPMPQVRCP